MEELSLLVIHLSTSPRVGRRDGRGHGENDTLPRRTRVANRGPEVARKDPQEDRDKIKDTKGEATTQTATQDKVPIKHFQLFGLLGKVDMVWVVVVEPCSPVTCPVFSHCNI
jgi:hypothetical protein